MPDIPLAGCDAEVVLILEVGAESVLGSSSVTMGRFSIVTSGPNAVVLTVRGSSFFCAAGLDSANETPTPPIKTATTVPTRVKLF